MERRSLRVIASYVVYPALVVMPLIAAMLALDHGVPELAVLLACIIACLIAQLALEHVMPFRREWNARRRVKDDLACIGLNAVTKQLVDLALLAWLYVVAAWLTKALGSPLWPSQWPLVLDLVLVILIADLGHYVAHRWLHDVGWLWAFHKMHHSPNSLDSLNFFRMHPLDIVIKTLLNAAPLILLGAPADALLLWMLLSAIAAGSVNHANIEMRTGWLDGLLSTPHLHRFHHSRRADETRCNLGNITVIYDRLFGTYCRPAARSVDEVGEPGGAEPLVVELLRPLQERSS